MTERVCIACKKNNEKNEFIKITKLKDNTVILNPNSKQTGYSVYICKNTDCIKQAIKKKLLYKKLKTNNTETINIIEEKLLQYLS